MKLHIKIMLMFSGLFVIAIVSLYVVLLRHMDQTLEQNLSDSTMDMAITLASMPLIQEGLRETTVNYEIQDYIETFRKNTRYHYIIVMDMSGIQYSYPYEVGIGKPYKNGGETAVLEQGIGYTSNDHNKLISAVRAFVPVYAQGEQVGALLVGLLTDEIQRNNEDNRRKVELVFVISLVLSVVASYILSLNIKTSIYGLEPEEIALLLSEKELILKSIHRGVLAMNLEGEILLYNEVAANLLKLPAEAKGTSLEVCNKPLYDMMTYAMASGENQEDQSISFGHKNRLMINTCLMKSASDHIVGVVISVEDYSVVLKMAEDITNYREIIDSLRAQKHEFMNRLHTLSGLLQIGVYEEAIDYIDNITKVTQRVSHLINEDIKNTKVAGLLLTKYSKLAEAQVDLIFHDHCRVDAIPEFMNADKVCSILGNLIENSFEALRDTKDPKIELLVVSDLNGLEIDLFNNGPLIEEDPQLIFKKEYSTKGIDRGIGLDIVKSIVEEAGGIISYENDQGVYWRVKI